ncbi:phosphotransferase [Paenibacillus sp. PL91]|uniref:phosphotransferase n=1 Tax=Paenibacillus sp. PL91 TaxID=2729538 RepID=UPI00145CF435|nr:phosphotransferase [Paenibacillus sp. PL91]MBC9198346.1 phosphotransferase [Paenibacillus sp. PL91]
MSDRGELVSQVLFTAERLGLTDIDPVILSEGGNLIIHLAPHAITARVAVVLSEKDAKLAHEILERELQVAGHLHNHGVPVLLPILNAGPHRVGRKWATFWQYAPPAPMEPLKPREAVELVNGLTLAMSDFTACTIPVLGIWERAYEAAARLIEQTDPRIQSLLDIFWETDNQMRMLKRECLIPVHGDAHARNLLPSPEGWKWNDFEDVSYMPAYWDLASYVGNLVLFGGFQEPTYAYLMSRSEIIADQPAFVFALTARTLVATVSNLDLALAGDGDLAFAFKQLELAEPFLSQIKRSLKP